MALVTNLLNAANGVLAGSAVALQRLGDQYGVFKVSKVGSITSFSMNIEGRMSPTDSWYVIATVTQADYDGNGSIARLVALWPEMRANQTAYVGTGNNTAWMGE